MARVAGILDMGEPTRFAFESAAITGLRAQWCLRSWRWHDADAMARAVVSEALHKLGVSRPTWAQGQPEFVEPVGGPRETCVRCGGAIPELDPQYRDRALYCSHVCATGARTDRRKAIGDQNDWAGELARRAAEKASRQKERARACVVCGASFVPARPERVACSKKCGRMARYAKGAHAAT